MTIEGRAAELAVALVDAGVNATADPRSATPPCVLVAPPDLEFDLNCDATATWQLWALAPGPGNPDALGALGALVRGVKAALPVERARFQSYVLSPDNPPYPAYRLELIEGITP